MTTHICFDCKHRVRRGSENLCHARVVERIERNLVTGATYIVYDGDRPHCAEKREQVGNVCPDYAPRGT